MQKFIDLIYTEILKYKWEKLNVNTFTGRVKVIEQSNELHGISSFFKIYC